jgi:hypothetical protein
MIAVVNGLGDYSCCSVDNDDDNDDQRYDGRTAGRVSLSLLPVQKVFRLGLRAESELEIWTSGPRADGPLRLTCHTGYYFFHDNWLRYSHSPIELTERKFGSGQWSR